MTARGKVAAVMSEAIPSIRLQVSPEKLLQAMAGPTYRQPYEQLQLSDLRRAFFSGNAQHRPGYTLGQRTGRFEETRHHELSFYTSLFC
jgi:hypothetical protein